MFSEKSRRKMREYWKNMMCSTHCKMTRGSEYLSTIITRARGDNWRRDHTQQRRIK